MRIVKFMLLVVVIGFGIMCITACGPDKPKCLMEVNPLEPTTLIFEEPSQYDGRHVVRATLSPQNNKAWKLTTYGESAPDPFGDSFRYPHVAEYKTQDEGIAAARDFCPPWGQ